MNDVQRAVEVLRAAGYDPVGIEFPFPVCRIADALDGTALLRSGRQVRFVIPDQGPAVVHEIGHRNLR